MVYRRAMRRRAAVALVLAVIPGCSPAPERRPDDFPALPGEPAAPATPGAAAPVPAGADNHPDELCTVEDVAVRATRRP